MFVVELSYVQCKNRKIVQTLTVYGPFNTKVLAEAFAEKSKPRSRGELNALFAGTNDVPETLHAVQVIELTPP